jgi:hypothetical protein
VTEEIVDNPIDWAAPQYAGYERRLGRELPVVLLEPVTGS